MSDTRTPRFPFAQNESADRTSRSPSPLSPCKRYQHTIIRYRRPTGAVPRYPVPDTAVRDNNSRGMRFALHEWRVRARATTRLCTHVRGTAIVTIRGRRPSIVGRSYRTVVVRARARRSRVRQIITIRLPFGDCRFSIPSACARRALFGLRHRHT